MDYYYRLFLLQIIAIQINESSQLLLYLIKFFKKSLICGWVTSSYPFCLLSHGG